MEKMILEAFQSEGQTLIGQEDMQEGGLVCWSYNKEKSKMMMMIMGKKNSQRAMKMG